MLQKIGSIGISSERTTEQNKKTSVINYASFFAILILGMHVVLNIYKGIPAVALANFMEFMVFVCILVFNFLHKYKASNFFLFIVFPVGQIPFSYFLGDIGIENYLFSFIILAFYIIKKPLLRYIISVYYIIQYMSVRIMINLDLYLNIEPEAVPSYYWSNIALSFFTLILISVAYTAENNRHLKKLNEQNEDLNKQYEYINKLLKELNHRVKNNLQIVSGLFNLQKYNTNNEEIVGAMTDAGNRILTISLLHKKLYQEDISTAEVSIKDYIKELCTYLLQSAGVENNTEFLVDVSDVKIPVEDCVHVGLIINEAVTNSIKYALNNESKNIIQVMYNQENNIVHIMIKDSGKGFSDSFKAEDSKSFGVFLMKTIVENYDGKIDFYNNNGAVVDVKFSIFI